MKLVFLDAKTIGDVPKLKELDEDQIAGAALEVFVKVRMRIILYSQSKTNTDW